jgi:hypothetical protein
MGTGNAEWLVVRDRSKLPPAYRKLALIAPEEIYEAIRQVVGNAIAITEQEAIPLARKNARFLTGDGRDAATAF